MNVRKIEVLSEVPKFEPGEIYEILRGEAFCTCGHRWVLHCPLSRVVIKCEHCSAPVEVWLDVTEERPE